MGLGKVDESVPKTTSYNKEKGPSSFKGREELEFVCTTS